MKRREPLPNLAHVLDPSRDAVPRSAGAAGRVPLAALVGDSRPSHRLAAAVAAEKRIHTRFDKTFLVVIGSELYGDAFAVARNVSSGGILVEMSYAPPLGTVVTVHFQHDRGDDRLDEIVVRSEVKHHHYLNFTGSGEAASTRAIGLRFLEFVDLGDRVDPQCLH